MTVSAINPSVAGEKLPWTPLTPVPPGPRRGSKAVEMQVGEVGRAAWGCPVLAIHILIAEMLITEWPQEHGTMSAPLHKTP